jgi:hypothetical protein
MQYFHFKFLILFLLLPLQKAQVVSFPTPQSDFEKSRFIYKSIDFGSNEEVPFPVFDQAINGYHTLLEEHHFQKPILAIIDFTKSANVKRLWVIDLKKKKLLYHCLTAHGKNSGEIFPHSFSNVHNSNKSCLGFFVTGKTYVGKHGTSLKLKGLEPHINDQAEARAIVMHGASYVSEEYIQKYGRLGRSFGCPAIPIKLHEQLIRAIAGGSCLFIYHSSKEYRDRSVFGKMSAKELSNSI